MKHLTSVLATIISIYIVLAAMRLLLVVERQKFYPDVFLVKSVDCTSFSDSAQHNQSYSSPKDSSNRRFLHAKMTPDAFPRGKDTVHGSSVECYCSRYEDTAIVGGRCMLTEFLSFDAVVEECNSLPFCAGITKHFVKGFGVYYTTHKTTTVESSPGDIVWFRGHCSAIGGVEFCDGATAVSRITPLILSADTQLIVAPLLSPKALHKKIIVAAKPAPFLHLVTTTAATQTQTLLHNYAALTTLAALYPMVDTVMAAEKQTLRRFAGLTRVITKVGRGGTLPSMVPIKPDDPNMVNTYGTPLLKSLLQLAIRRADEAAQGVRAARHVFFGYSNSDIIFGRNLPAHVQAAAKAMQEGTIGARGVLLVGRRTNVAGLVADYDTLKWDNLNVEGDMFVDMAVNVSHRAHKAFHSKEGCLFHTDAQDYFFFSRDAIDWNVVPDYVIGRPGYDNYLVRHAISRGVDVIDLSRSVRAVHLSKSYSFEDSNSGLMEHCDERFWNRMQVANNIRALAESYCRVSDRTSGAGWVTFLKRSFRRESKSTATAAATSKDSSDPVMDAGMGIAIGSKQKLDRSRRLQGLAVPIAATGNRSLDWHYAITEDFEVAYDIVMAPRVRKWKRYRRAGCDNLQKDLTDEEIKEKMGHRFKKYVSLFEAIPSNLRGHGLAQCK